MYIIDHLLLCVDTGGTLSLELCKLSIFHQLLVLLAILLLLYEQLPSTTCADQRNVWLSIP